MNSVRSRHVRQQFTPHRWIQSGTSGLMTAAASPEQRSSRSLRGVSHTFTQHKQITRVLRVRSHAHPHGFELPEVKVAFART